LKLALRHPEIGCHPVRPAWTEMELVCVKQFTNSRENSAGLLPIATSPHRLSTRQRRSKIANADG
jgi:hypothetical protein